MLVRLTRALIAALLCLSLATAASAADEKKPQGVPGREAMIKKFDKNGDGKLDQSEMQAARAAMGDRKPGTPGQFGGGPGGAGGRPSPEMMKEMLKKFDKNGDGKLDDSEKNAAREQFMKMRGGKPGDGAGKPGEGKSGAGKPGAGKPGAGDQGARREAFMKEFDKNGDGKLDDSEKAAAKEAFEKMRAGGDPGAGKKPGANKN